MSSIKLTNKNVEALKAKAKEYCIYDSLIAGFGCKVTPKGRRVYFYYYRTPMEKKAVKITIGKHGHFTAEKARKIAGDYAAKIARGIDPKAEQEELSFDLKSSLTLKEFFEIYKKKVVEDMIAEAESKAETPIEKKNARKTIEHNHIYNFEKYIYPCLGERKIGLIQKEDVEKLDQYIQSLRTEKNTLKTTTNRCIAKLRVVLECAMRWGYREEGKNPCEHYQKYPERKNMTFLIKQEALEVYESLSNPAVVKHFSPYGVAAIKIMLLTGQRSGNIKTLKWKDINFDEQYFYLKITKNKHPLKVDIDDRCIEVFQSVKKQPDNPYVFCGEVQGTHIQELKKILPKVIKFLALKKKVRIHDLRHTFASLAINSGIPLYTVGQMLGHTNIQTTKRYAHLEREHLKQEREKITSIFSR